MKQKFLSHFFAGLCLLPYLASAEGFGSCRDQFAFGVPPVIMIKGLAAKTDELCSSGHATLHSGITKTPLYSAEYLTRARLRDAKELSRTDSYRSDSRLPAGREARLTDYARSGYDRGHIAPNGDMPGIEEQSDSFLLSNIVPQNPGHNRNLWAGIEYVTRVMAARNNIAYVVTGAAFLGNTVRIGSGVAVPTHLYKAIYFPQISKASAWFSANAEGGEYEVISITELTRRVGIDVFPSLSEAVKSEVQEFYKPKKQRRSLN